MAASKGRGRGAGKGDGRGESEGEEPRARLDWDRFLVHLKEHAAALVEDVAVYESGVNGRTWGAYLNVVRAAPIETLTERLRAVYEGPRTLVVRSRGKDGQFKQVGELALGAPSRTAAPSSSDAAFQMLLMQKLEALEARMNAGPPQQPPLPVSEQVGALRDIVGVAKELSGGGNGGGQKPLSASDFKSILELGAKMAGNAPTGLAQQALETFKDDIGAMLKLTAAMLTHKLTSGGKANE